jgi:hypothetical protein
MLLEHDTIVWFLLQDVDYVWMLNITFRWVDGKVLVHLQMLVLLLDALLPDVHILHDGICGTATGLFSRLMLGSAFDIIKINQ